MNIPRSALRCDFLSDNASGICPEALDAIRAANSGYAPSYGEDEWTRQVCDQLREFFETDCEVFFVFNGTAANSLSLAALCQSYHSIICHEISHVETDECGAPEFFSHGTKLLLVPGKDGKVDLDAVETTVKRRSDIHYPKPRVLSITQATELGTAYTVRELQAVGEKAKSLGLHVHMDGARLANALVALNASPSEITWKAGVDVLCLGGAKNGLIFGDPVIFFDKRHAAEFDFRCKQAGQLFSKMRFVAAQWSGTLDKGHWLRHARHANDAAHRLEKAIRTIPGLTIMFPCETNSVFVEMPPPMIDGLRQRGWHFYTFIGVGGARFTCSWDTTDSSITDLVNDLRDLARIHVK
jgi:threonine aldolase